MPFIAQPTEKCLACARSVYATERLVVEEKDSRKIFHKTCLRCKECNKVLGLGQYSSLDGVYYCKPHFKQLFASKGNYDDAFGKEKITSKWAPSAAPAAPGSFIPAASEAKSEKKQTSEETLAKLRRFKEEGDSNKCRSCEKAVYMAEKLLVEDKTEKLLFHKACFRCSVCELILDLRNYGSVEGKIYCKNHLKEVSDVVSKPRPSSVVIPGKASFVPPNPSEENKPEKKSHETSEAVAAKFRRFRQEGESEKCLSCEKTVYMAEKLLVEDKSGKMLFHKLCFRCSVCNLSLDLRNYGSINGIIYCKNHLKEHSQLDKPGSTFVAGSGSFVPEVKEERRQEKTPVPEHIAAKFKGLGSTGEKCASCGKSVYATEKITVEELTKQTIFHKNCLRCSVCQIKLDLSSFGSSGGTIFCKVHLKQQGMPEQVKSENAYFVSPLASRNDDYVPGARENDQVAYSDDEGTPAPSQSQEDTLEDRQEEAPSIEEPPSSEEAPSEEAPSNEEPVEQEKEVEKEPEKEPEPSPSPSTNDERERRREERRRQQQEEEERWEEERRKRIEERERRLAQSDSQSAEDSPSVSGSDREEERRKRREERQREREEEERKLQEDRERREREREERRKQREEEEAREEEEREQRRLEREERRKRLEEEARQEEEEVARRAEERRKRLEALKEEE